MTVNELSQAILQFSRTVKAFGELLKEYKSLTDNSSENITPISEKYRRVIHLSKHSKKARVRIKNINRLKNLYKEVHQQKYLSK